MTASGGVPRPLKRNEFVIELVSKDAERGWRDLLATQRSSVVDAWDFLTRTPRSNQPSNHALRGALATVTHKGTEYERRQCELSNGARIWYFVVEQRVCIFQVHTHHPNATKGRRG